MDRLAKNGFQKDYKIPISPQAIELNSNYIHTPNGKQSYKTPYTLETVEIPVIIIV